MHGQSTGKASPSIGRGARPNRSRPRSLPSAIEICLAEKISPAKAKRLARDKRFFKELQDQVLHDLSHFPYVDTLDCTEPLDANDFILYSSAEISPLRLEGKCNCSACLAKYVAEFARGSCLYADVVVLTDSFGEGILRTPPGRWTPDGLMRSISVLTKLEPLMRGGVIRFSRWVYSRCTACGQVGKKASEHVASPGHRCVADSPQP